jgi:copper transport protein
MMSWWQRAAGAAALAALALLGIAPAEVAWAHASLISAQPSDGAVVAASPESLVLTFNEPVAPLRLQLLGPNGQLIVVPDVMQHDATLVATVPRQLGEGTHVLSWRVVSADGHPVGGTVIFSIGREDAAPPAVETQSELSLRIAIWAARLGLFTALLFGVGGAVFAAWIAAAWPLPKDAEKLVVALLAGGIFVLPVSLGLHGLDALGLSLAALTRAEAWEAGYGTTYGTAVVLAMLSLGLALLAMRAEDREVARLRSFGALAALGLAFAASGHAASAPPQAVMRPAVFLHAVAVALWLGSLWPLMLLVRAGDDLGRNALRRFSRSIPWALLPLVASGIVLAINQLTRIEDFWTTAYGAILLLKIFAVLVLFGLAAMNRFRLTRRVQAGDAIAHRQLRRSIVGEVAIALVILAAVALWRFTPPPRALAAAEVGPEFVHFHTETAVANMSLDLGKAGRSTAKVVVRRGDYEPLTPKGVTLIFSRPELGIEPIKREAVDAGDHVWQVDDILLPTPGRWRLRIDILINDFEKITLDGAIQIRR